MNQTSERIGSRLHRLSEVSMMKQVEPLSYALFPGYHCPLMGAMLTIGKIRDAVMLVIGPDECTYYTKMATSDGGRMASEGCQIVSVVLDQHDVTFGCKEAITEAFQELNEEYHPKCVFAVTTCVPEVTGDDVESMAAVFSSQYGFPVVVVHAENFKTDDHMPGIEHTLTGCLPLMQPKECNGSVNVLGLRLGDFSKTETCRILRENGVPVGLTLPGSCSVSDIQNAPTAKVNLVVHPVGLPLAKAMEELGYSDVSELPQLSLVTWDASEQKLLLETIIDQWKQNLGLTNIQLNQYVIGTAIGSFYDLSYDIFCITWETDVLPTDVMESMMTGGECNYGIWSDPEYDKLVEQAVLEIDPVKQAELTSQAEQIFLDDAGIVPIFENSNTSAVQSYVEGFQMTAINSGYQFNHLVVRK